MKKSEVAVNKFMDGYNCAQSVLYSFCDDLGMDQDIALKMSCGFGAGMGRKEEVCGAVTGGIMVLGLIYGRGDNEDSLRKEKTYQKTNELMDKFAERQGTYICMKLLDNCDMTTSKGREVFEEKDLLNKVCKKCVQNTVEIIEKMI